MIPHARQVYLVLLLSFMFLPAVALPLLVFLLAAIGANMAATYLGFVYVWPAYQLVALLDTGNGFRDRLFVDFGVGITLPLGLIACEVAWMILGTIVFGVMILAQRLCEHFAPTGEIKDPKEY